MFGKRNAISSNVGWGCWRINFPNRNKDQDGVANVGPNSDSHSLHVCCCVFGPGKARGKDTTIHTLKIQSIGLTALRHVEKSKA